MATKVITYAKKQPARAIVSVICGITILTGLFMFTPFYGPVEAVPLFGGPVNAIGIYATAALNMIIPSVALYGVLTDQRIWVARGSFIAFLWYLFISLSRLLLFPAPGRLLWVPSLMIALVMGIIYLEKKNLLQQTIRTEVIEDRAGDGG